eukprot:CAMPEP_0113556736 /NCGR_PEP_ID=MMETSP0015_2-20120614/17411_1 /TAXON_ID=2838 /ORGANISM="Odontella" /LENGTH=192 /DNA_ID=CAMNT_0000458103 /DNA_START=399 /DNA_END=977 /DNA_ORIENTATION=- /assembly_acc=CAM_ASM_000160
MSTEAHPKSSSGSDKLEDRCKKAVARLVELKINFLAIDFDQTIIDIHTGGVWKGTLPELAERVRPMFKALIQEAHSNDIKLAVVTFSPQVGFIREFLHVHFPDFSDTIIIRGRDRSWSYEGAGCRQGKQSHMASAAEELLTRHPDAEITKATTLLIDDDANNIRVALGDGVRAIWLNPNKSNNLMRDVRNLV